MFLAPPSLKPPIASWGGAHVSEEDLVLRLEREVAAQASRITSQGKRGQPAAQQAVSKAPGAHSVPLEDPHLQGGHPQVYQDPVAEGEEAGEQAEDEQVATPQDAQHQQHQEQGEPQSGEGSGQGYSAGDSPSTPQPF